MLFILQLSVHTMQSFCTILCVVGGISMAFQLQPNKKESENKTIRFPLPLIERINQALIGTEVSFSSFVIQACEFALDNLDDSGHESTQEKKS